MKQFSDGMNTASELIFYDNNYCCLSEGSPLLCHGCLEWRLAPRSCTQYRLDDSKTRLQSALVILLTGWCPTVI